MWWDRLHLFHLDKEILKTYEIAQIAALSLQEKVITG